MANKTPTGIGFDASTHTYTLSGVVVPSVTQVLRASGLIDFSSVPAGVMLAAQERGRAVHSAIHYYEEHDLDLAQFKADFPDVEPYLQSWIDFKRRERFEGVFHEKRVASKVWQCAGTFDALGLFRGAQPVLLDFKSGRPQDVCAHLQTAAYESLARDQAAHGDADLWEFFEEYPGLTRMSVQLMADGSPAKTETYRDPRDASKFLALLNARRIVEAEKGAMAAWGGQVAEGEAA